MTAWGTWSTRSRSPACSSSRWRTSGRGRRGTSPRWSAVLLPAPSRLFDDAGVQERTRLVRPATRETMARAELDAEQVRAVRTSFGPGGDFAMTGAEAFEAVMGRGTALSLANGWRLARRRIMGADRVEIEGPVDGDTDALKRMGCTVEIVSWRARAFAPAAHVLDRILERWPLAA